MCSPLSYAIQFKLFHGERSDPINTKTPRHDKPYQGGPLLRHDKHRPLDPEIWEVVGFGAQNLPSNSYRYLAPDHSQIQGWMDIP